MGTETPLRIPFVDFSKIDQDNNTLDWELTKSQVHQALEEFGCFETKVASISPELQTSMFESLQQLFDLPLQTKLKNQSLKPFHSYVGHHPKVPLYEGMGIDDAPILEKVESFTKMLWPEGNPKVCMTIHEFAEKLRKLDQMVRKMVLESLGLNKYLDEHIGSGHYLLRVMKYKAPQTNESQIGLRAHTDKNFVTILHQNQVEGLELQTKSGNWIKIQPSPDSYIVMIGDAFHAWTNGLLHSTYHQVMMSGEKARYCIGLFSMPKPGYVVKAPEEVVDEEHPLLFKPYDHFEFLQFFYTEAGQRAPSALKAYCGA